VDETLDSLHAVGAQEGIVIAIDNGGGNRIEEYAPWVHPRYGGGKADQFLQWVVSSLKPHIDSALRTRPEKGCTAIAGSSMGGLAACYAWMKYPDVFGSAGVFSPSFWFSSDIFTLAESRQISPSDRVYLMAGKGEGEEMCAGVMTIDSLLTKKGCSGHQLYMHIDPTGTHSESFWAVNFAHFWQWLAKTW
jgi:alpha-glucosidase